jgi:hypothetical protein
LINIRSETGDQDLSEDYDLKERAIAIAPLLEDGAKIQSVDGFAHQEFQQRYKTKRHTEEVAKHVNNGHVTANTKIVRMTKNVSHQ